MHALNLAQEPSVVAGHRTERVLVGERETRRLAGYDTQLVVIEPARVDKVRECVDVPEQIVTVVSDGAAGVVPLPGTSEVLTEEAYQARLAAVR